MDTCITAHCTIRGHRIHLNGALVYEAPDPAADLNTFLVGAYRHFGVQYPKFFKMDSLCKLAFLTAELVLPAAEVLARLAPHAVGLVLANRSSSLLTDLAHQRSIADAAAYFPSPSVFVYTLPNILIGEISIRHQLTGENSLFVADAFEPATLDAYAAQLLAEGASQACLCGWVEAAEDAYESFFYVVEQGVAPLPHHVASLNTLHACSLTS
jgi:hypothetical protein